MPKPAKKSKATLTLASGPPVIKYLAMLLTPRGGDNVERNVWEWDDEKNRDSFYDDIMKENLGDQMLVKGTKTNGKDIWQAPPGMCCPDCHHRAEHTL